LHARRRLERATRVGRRQARRHPAQADEASADRFAVVFTPDYTSKAGESVRTIDIPASFGDALTLVTVESDGVIFGTRGKDWVDERIHR